MDFSEVKKKFIEARDLALKRLIEERKKENSYLIFSINGKIVKVNAHDIKLEP